MGQRHQEPDGVFSASKAHNNFMLIKMLKEFLAFAKQCTDLPGSARMWNELMQGQWSVTMHQIRMSKYVWQVTGCCLKIAIRQCGIVVLLGLDSRLFPENLCYALSKNHTIGLYRIKRCVKCIINGPATRFVSSGITRLSSVRTVLVTATRCMLWSLTTRAAKTTRCNVRRSGMVSSARLREFRRHKKGSVTSFRLWPFWKWSLNKIFEVSPKIGLRVLRTVPRDVLVRPSRKKKQYEPCEPRDCRHKFSWDENLLLEVQHCKNIIWNVFTEKCQQRFNDPCSQKCLMFE